MQIQTYRSGSLPKKLTTELLATKTTEDNCPGLIVSTKQLLDQNLVLSRSVSGMLGPDYPKQFPALLATPEATASIFQYTAELSFLKSVASYVAAQVHPNLKLGVDAVWLVYGAAQLHDEWTRPGADVGTCMFKLAGLGLSAVNLVGGVQPDLKLNDSWSNGINFCLKSGEALYHGKTPPINELVLATDKRMDVPLKLLKLAGVSLDPQSNPTAAALGAAGGMTLLAPSRASRSGGQT